MFHACPSDLCTFGLIPYCSIVSVPPTAQTAIKYHLSAMLRSLLLREPLITFLCPFDACRILFMEISRDLATSAPQDDNDGFPVIPFKIFKRQRQSRKPRENEHKQVLFLRGTWALEACQVGPNFQPSTKQSHWLTPRCRQWVCASAFLLW